MILYFSGTGNSLYIAKQLARLTGDRIISIAELTLSNIYSLSVLVVANALLFIL